MQVKRVVSNVRGLITIFAAVLMVYSCGNAEPSSKKQTGNVDKTAAVATVPQAAPTETKADSRQLVVYYFHTTFRCPSCNYIEQTTEAAIKETFADELASGRMVFKSINIEEKGNEHFAKDYTLYTKSVIVSDMVNGEQTRWKNLEKVWQLIRKDDDFRAYIITEVKAYLGA